MSHSRLRTSIEISNSICKYVIFTFARQFKFIFSLLIPLEGELACVIDAQLQVRDSIVRVVVSHNGNSEDKLDRFLQVCLC